MSNSGLLQIRVESELKDRIKAKADSQDRTIQGYVLRLIKADLGELDNLPAVRQEEQLPAKKPREKKTITVCTKESITREQFQEMLDREDLCNGNGDLLQSCFFEMLDWSRSGLKKKADWAATLRNWIRKSKASSKAGPKSFAQIENEYRKQQRQEFLKMTEGL